jgi:hypothetical protein
MEFADRPLVWIWSHETQFRGVLGCLALATAAESVLLSSSHAWSLVDLVLWGGLAYLVALCQLGIWWALGGGVTARELSATLLLFCSAAAALEIFTYAAAREPTIGNVWSVVMIAAAAATEPVWRDLERDNPSVAQPDSPAERT